LQYYIFTSVGKYIYIFLLHADTLHIFYYAYLIYLSRERYYIAQAL